MDIDPEHTRLDVDAKYHVFNIESLKTKYFENQERELLFGHIYEHLYLGVKKHKVHRYIERYTEQRGLCTVKWLEETVAVKCYDCQSDATCAICLECFFRSDHTGHRFRLTRTSGGCCDCGDNAAWRSEGTCTMHNAPLTPEDERALLGMFHSYFVLRVRNTLTRIAEEITDYVQTMNPVKEGFVHMLLMFLDDFLKVTPAYRLIMTEVLQEKWLKLWIRKHNTLSHDVRKGLNSFYLTMLTSMSFKTFFADAYVHFYRLIILPFRESADEWQLNHLSVQIFTYPNIAAKAIQYGFLEECLHLFTDESYTNVKMSTLSFKRVDTSLFESYLRTLGDFAYVMNHKEVATMILEMPKLQLTIFKLLRKMHHMNTIVRATGDHVLYENTGYIVSFACEHSLHMAFRPLSEAIKADIAKASWLYKYMNEFIQEQLCSWILPSKRLCRSFHVPFVRFFGSAINADHLAGLFKRGASEKELRDDVIVSSFDNDVLLWILKQTIDVIRFSMEVKHRLWVHNGETMFDQVDYYRRDMLMQRDLSTMQLVLMILLLKRKAGLCNVKPMEYIYKEVFKSSVVQGEGQNTVQVELPGDASFKITLFMHLVTSIIHDIKMLEMLSLSDVNSPDYIRRGYPLMKMDLVVALSTGMLDFKEVTSSIDSHWKRHPHIVQTLEEVASLNYSPLADKTYVRLKNEAYQMIDVLWEPHENIADVSIPQDVLKRGYSMLGLPRSVQIMQPEYYDVQDAVLHGLGVADCVRVVYSFLGIIHQKKTQKCSSTEEQKEELQPVLSENDDFLFKPEDRPGNIDGESPEHHAYFEGCMNFPDKVVHHWKTYILSAIKILHLLMDATTILWKDSAKVFVEMLENIQTLFPEELILKSAITNVTRRMKEEYHLEIDVTEEEKVDDTRKNMKSVQSRFMMKLMEKQKRVKVEDLRESETSSPVEEEYKTCVLCREKMDDENPMSFMCLISTNSVMRNCVQSIWGRGVYEKASLPRSSSIISSCGHVAHTKCIKEHRENYVRTSMLMNYSIDRLNTEYFCPICKVLCNYTMEFATDRIVNLRANRLHILDTLTAASKCNWRYKYCANWVPSPIHAKVSAERHVLYTFSSLLPRGEGTPQQLSPRSFMEDLKRNDSHKSGLKCEACVETNVLSSPFNPQCRALLFPKENRNTKINVSHIVKQLADRVNQHPEIMEGINKLLKFNSAKGISRRLSGDYCLAVFSGEKTVYGIQNWRHSICGEVVDSKMWILYNQIMATCACARNQLTVKPSLLRNLIRSCYAMGLQVGKNGIGTFTPDLDTYYFDAPLKSFYVPMQLPRNDEHVDILTFLVESMTNEQVIHLASSLSLVIKESETTETDQSNMELNDGVVNMQVASPWSKDILREFMLWFVDIAPDHRESLDGLSKALGTLIMQVIEREALQDVKRSFEAFLDQSAETEKDHAKYQRLKFKRKFVRTLYETFFREYLDSAEIPGDLLGRVDWMGFKEYETDYRLYNGCKEEAIAKENTNISDYLSTMDPIDIALEPVEDVVAHRGPMNSITGKPMTSDALKVGIIKGGFYMTDSIYLNMTMSIEDRAAMNERLRLEHERTVDTFTRPLPESPNGELSDQVRSYLYDQIKALLEVRRIHAIAENGINSKDLDSLIEILSTNREGGYRMEKDQRKPMDFLFQERPASNSKNEKPQGERRYFHGMDFVRRINEEAYRAHCNYAFFEVIRNLVPRELHLVDFATADVCNHITNIDHSDDITQMIKNMIKITYDSLKERGYLKSDFIPDVDRIMSMMMRHLNFVLDAGFWIVHSVFETDEDIYTKVSYAHLQSDETRFNLLLDVCKVRERSSMVKMTSADMMSYSEIMTLNLLRSTGLETLAPLISGYDYIDMRKHVTEDAWDLIKLTTFRMCPTCGTQPANPLICLICGSMVCHYGVCCDRNKNVDASQLLDEMERDNLIVRMTDITNIYTDEVVAHTYSCGGGQGVYISPYNCYLIFMDEVRHCITSTLYTDKYGNRDLHSRVYGPLTISQTSLTKITSALCQGKLTHEIINIHKEALT